MYSKTSRLLQALAFSTLFCTTSFSQRGDTLLGYSRIQSVWQFSWMDIPTTTFNSSTTASLVGLQQGQSSYDRVSNRYFIKGYGISVIDAVNGMILGNVPNISGMNNFEYDEICDCLVAPDTQNGGQFTQVDIVTGLKTVIGPIQANGIYFGESTFDRINRRYFFRSMNGINSIDAQGVMPPVMNTPIRGIEYDATLELLFGALIINSQWYFASYNFTTMQTTTLSALPGATYYGGETTYDEANHRYFTQNTQGIVVVDALTGNVIKTIPTTDEIRGIEYGAFVETTGPVDPVDTGIRDFTNKKEISVYPNPSNGQLTVKNVTNGDHLQVFDLFGKQITEAIVSGDSVTYDLMLQEKGVYICTVTNENYRYFTKIVIR